MQENHCSCLFGIGGMSPLPYGLISLLSRGHTIGGILSRRTASNLCSVDKTSQPVSFYHNFCVGMGPPHLLPCDSLCTSEKVLSHPLSCWSKAVARGFSSRQRTHFFHALRSLEQTYNSGSFSVQPCVFMHARHTVTFFLRSQPGRM